MNLIQRFLILLIVIVLGCRSTQQESVKSDDGRQEQMKPTEPGPGVPPDHCRVVGTIVAVTTAIGSNSDDPCAKAPCIAVVKIDEILGYGSAFGTPLKKGKEIRVQFRYTLGPTKEHFPTMSPELPGLTVGSKFQADVRAPAATIAGEPQTSTFSVGTYTVR